ncbi:MAG: flagellar basal-body rod protein FlgF [Thermoanaerobacteraceae bacterium]|nr:flagellar basal-body rod protein FlgF [Thermoanaerobacteraceae bacterium]MDN5302277.1 flagellar basal-body rod protein FlgF [Thermoanaerobacteraceae bacterium]
MIRGLYTAASGLVAEMARTDVISNNLANVNTSGFKKDRAIFRAFPEMNIHRIGDPAVLSPKDKIDPKPFIGVLGTGSMLDEINTNFSQGSIKNTSNPLDLALTGEGFFEVQTPGGVRYTRDGSFTRNQQGYLVTGDGHYVMGLNGPIQLPDGKDISINRRGEVFSDGSFVDRLLVAAFADQRQLLKEGDNLYVSNQQPLPSNSEVIQGALEGSNVNPISEMVDLITAFRAYEASQRVVKANDDTLGKAVNDIARL